MRNIYVYILVTALVSYAIRVTPLTLIRKPITNRFIRSFLYYVPYATLAVMTFPAMIMAVESPAAGIISFITGILLAWNGKPLLLVSVVCCAVVFILQIFL